MLKIDFYVNISKYNWEEVKLSKSNNKAFDISNILDSVNIEFRKTALFRLRFWININSKASHSSEAFWNRSTDHRVICMIAINASLGQVPVELSVGPNKRDIVSYEVLRRLCRCTDKTMRTIVQEGVDREDIIKVRMGRETFIRATSKLLKTFESFEQEWIQLVKKNNKL